MKCVTCGHETEYDFRFCPNCGAAAGPANVAESAAVVESAPAAAPTATEPLVQTVTPVVFAQTGTGSHPTAYVRADYDPSRDGRIRQQAASQSGMPYTASQPSPYVSSQAGSGVYHPAENRPAASTAASAAAAASAADEPRPSTTAQIVLASINIIFVGLGISFVLGIIALVFTIMASGETVVSEAWSKLRTAKTLNIIGLVFLAIQLLVIIIMITAGIVMFANVFSQTGPTFGGDYPLG